MNHDLRVTVWGRTQLELVKKASAEADRFYGPGNWREEMPADVYIGNTGYRGEYYFTDVPY